MVLIFVRVWCFCFVGGEVEGGRLGVGYWDDDDMI